MEAAAHDGGVLSIWVMDHGSESECSSVASEACDVTERRGVEVAGFGQRADVADYVTSAFTVTAFACRECGECRRTFRRTDETRAIMVLALVTAGASVGTRQSYGTRGARSRVPGKE